MVKKGEQVRASSGNSGRSTEGLTLPYVIQLITTLLGVAISLYLLTQHTRLKSGIQDGKSFCALGKYADCDVVSASQYSEFRGIPLAAIGATFYFVMFLLSVVVPIREPIARRFQRIVFYLTVAAGLVDLSLLGIQAFALKNFCIFCIATYFCTTVLFFTSARLQTEAGLGFWGTIWAAFSGSLPPAQGKISATALFSAFLSLVCFIAVLVLLPQSLKLKSTTYSGVENYLNNFFETWKDKPAQRLPSKDGDGTFGNSAARIQVVEFSDFQCPHCKRAAFTVHTFLKSSGANLSFIFKHFPLDNACNPAVTFQMHEHACELARLAYCATKKGKFWEYHDAVFFNTDEKLPPVKEIVKDGPLKSIFTIAEYEKCLADPASLQSVKDDLG